jgi:16S rRNA A1518/A1519 N6-dimethyltransferase RsmA/KsgA/DIM1 with predicted DNA glycosylase/AP lyase activity
MKKYVYIVLVYYEITSYEEELQDVIVCISKELANKIANSKNNQEYTRAVVKRKQLLS